MWEWLVLGQGYRSEYTSVHQVLVNVCVLQSTHSASFSDISSDHFQGFTTIN